MNKESTIRESSAVAEIEDPKSNPVTLVVLGAGASFDAGFQSPTFRGQSTPLTKDLVKALRSQPHSNKAEGVLAAIDECMTTGVDFESAVRKLYFAFKSDPVMMSQFIEFRSGLRELMRLSLAAASNVDSNYTALAAKFLSSTERAATKRELILLNLNYDPIAEFAINKRTVFGSMQEHFATELRPISLLHPHGACFWGVNQSGEFERMPNSLESGFSPALAIPMNGDEQGKFCWPEAQRAYLATRLPSVDRVAVIGWRGADGHVVELLGQGLRTEELQKFYVVGKSNVDEPIANLKAAFPEAEFVACLDGFGGFVSSTEIRELMPSNF